jgi:hypothetical protein
MRNPLTQMKAGALEGVSSVQSGVAARAARLSDPRSITLLSMLVAALAAPLINTGVAAAAAATATQGGCTSGAAQSLFKFVEDAARLMIGFGAVGSLLMLAVGAGFIMFSAGNEGRARKGMTIVKNVVVALAIFGGGIFIKFVVLNFVGAATTFDTPTCAGAADTAQP